VDYIANSCWTWSVKKKITTVSIFISIVAIWLWDLRNNYLFYNMLQFLTFVLFITYILYKVSRLEVGPLAETYFFLLKTTQIWVITIVVVLDQSTNDDYKNFICPLKIHTVTFWVHVNHNYQKNHYCWLNSLSGSLSLTR
jgi:hypothetical protein